MVKYNKLEGGLSYSPFNYAERKGSVGLLVNKMVKSRGNYMVLHTSESSKFVIYKAYDFDTKEFIIDENGVERRVADNRKNSWIIYGASPYTGRIEITNDIATLAENLIKLSPLKDKFKDVKYIRFICRGSDCVIILCSFKNKIKYRGIRFIVYEGGFYVSVSCAGFSLETEEEPKVIHLGNIVKTRSCPTTRNSWFPMEIDEGISSEIVRVSGKVLAKGLSSLEFPVCEDYSSFHKVICDDLCILSNSIHKDIPFYFKEVISSESMAGINEEVKKENVTGYGLNCSDRLKDTYVQGMVGLGKESYVKTIQDNSRTVGYNILYPVQDEDDTYVFLKSNKCGVNTARIEEVVSNAGDSLFYTIKVSALTCRYSYLDESSVNYLSSSLSKSALQKALGIGKLPAPGSYLQVSGISIKNIVDTDTSITLYLEYRGVDVTLSYSRVSRMYESGGFPNVGIDCDVFMRAVLKKLGYTSFRDYCVYYKAYKGNKCIGTFKTLDECARNFVGLTCWAEKYRKSDDKFLGKYLYRNKTKQSSKFIKEGE